jgi:hypothetical protein
MSRRLVDLQAAVDRAPTRQDVEHHLAAAERKLKSAADASRASGSKRQRMVDDEVAALTARVAAAEELAVAQPDMWHALAEVQVGQPLS